MTALRTLYELFPPKVREQIKKLMAASGHGASRFDGIKARDHALGKKRLDRVAEKMTAVLGPAGITSLEGRSCMEFGAGYVPSEILVFYLLGGINLVATDYNPIAQLSRLALSASSADHDKLMATLSPFSEPERIRARLAPLVQDDARAATDFILRHVTYVAPHDMSQSGLTERVDFIHSVSVLEHLPVAASKPILENLLASLNSGGAMIHEIDFCDHLDMENAPLAFLAVGDDYDPQRDFDRRGNRLRRSDWLEILGALPETQTSILYERQQREEHIPPALQPEFAARPDKDLHTSWMGTLTRRFD